MAKRRNKRDSDQTMLQSSRTGWGQESLKVEDEAGQGEVERDEDGSHVHYLYTVSLYC